MMDGIDTFAGDEQRNASRERDGGKTGPKR